MDHQTFAQLLGNYGEFIGAIGVVVTLVYLALQIRQNTAQLTRSELSAQAAAVNASNLVLREPRRALIESGELTEMFIRGNESVEELGEVPRTRYRLLMQNVVDTMVVILRCVQRHRSDGFLATPLQCTSRCLWRKKRTSATHHAISPIDPKTLRN